MFALTVAALVSEILSVNELQHQRNNHIFNDFTSPVQACLYIEQAATIVFFMGFIYYSWANKSTFDKTRTNGLHVKIAAVSCFVLILLTAAFNMILLFFFLGDRKYEFYRNGDDATIQNTGYYVRTQQFIVIGEIIAAFVASVVAEVYDSM